MAVPPYWKNFFGLKMTEEEDQTLNYPLFELYVHVTDKAVQLGCTVGSCLFGPIICAAKGPRNFSNLSRLVVKSGTIGLGIGLILGPAMTYARAGNDPIERNYDRSYRIRHNRNQLNIDRFYRGGLLLGLTGAVVGGLGLPGVVAGIAGGTISGNIYNISVPDPNPKPKKQKKTKEDHEQDHEKEAKID